MLNIPTEIKEIDQESKISADIKCETHNVLDEIYVPSEWMKTGTLVEYEAVGKICPKYNSIKACQKATTLNMTCIWCEKVNTCIESSDQDTHHLKVNDCRVE
ncbi:unnamed protein product, partial [Schistosoma haematobium]